jgi:putative proteasome-type protease
MTYCLIMKVQDGLVGVADTMITSGRECLTAKKVVIPKTSGKHSFFLMCSGLRSLRDKTLTYFQEVIDDEAPSFNKLYKIVNSFASQIRRVSKEDKEYLAEGGLDFNIFTLVAGQLEEDEEHKLYMIYPEGNWIEVGQSAPYLSIGNTGYGKPILDRCLKYESSMEFALKVGFLAFSATKLSATDVDYPLDVVLMKKDGFYIVSQRYSYEDLYKYADKWTELISESVREMPDEWTKSVFNKLV